MTYPVYRSNCSISENKWKENTQWPSPWTPKDDFTFQAISRLKDGIWMRFQSSTMGVLGHKETNRDIAGAFEVK